jgi:hypothetical protein
MPTTQSSEDRYRLVRGGRVAPGFRSYEALQGDGAEGVLVDVFTGTHPLAATVLAFERDVATVSSLRHPHILHTLERATLRDGTPIVVSELPVGETLQAWLDAGNTAPASVTVEVVVALADALAAAHACGVQHGALCEENVFLVGAARGAPGSPKLKGFGLAWIREARVTTEGGGDNGDAARIQDDRGPSTRVAGDIAALALLAERLLTLMEPPANEIDRRFILGDEVIAVLERARGQSLDDPFESITRFVVELKAAVIGEPDMSMSGDEPATHRSRRGRRWLGISLGLASFCATVVVAFGLGGPLPGGFSLPRWSSSGLRVDPANPGTRAAESETRPRQASTMPAPAPIDVNSGAPSIEAAGAGSLASLEGRRTERGETEIPRAQPVPAQGRARGHGIVWSPSLGRVVYLAPVSSPPR